MLEPMQIAAPDPVKVPITIIEAVSVSGHPFSVVLEPDLGDFYVESDHVWSVHLPRNREVIHLQRRNVLVLSIRQSTRTEPPAKLDPHAPKAPETR